MISTSKTFFEESTLIDSCSLLAYFKVSYPQTNIENNANEGLLKQFWHHTQAYYFKKIEDDQIRRITYLEDIFRSSGEIEQEGESMDHLPFASNHAFLEDLHEVFDDHYIQQIIGRSKNDTQTQNLLKYLFIEWKISSLHLKMRKEQQNKSKIIYSKLKQNRRQKQLLQSKKVIAKYLQDEKTDLDQIIFQLKHEQDKHKDQISTELALLEEEMSQIKTDNNKSVTTLLNKISKQNKTPLASNKRTGTQHQNMDSENFDLHNDLQSIEYLIKSLEEKQIAESISKIIGSDKIEGEIKYKVTFEKAINIEPKYLNESQFLHLNQLRETSLVNFYRTGIKSMYSFICHNYVGFRDFNASRCNISSKFKDKDIFQMMKKGACLSNLPEIQYEMNQFNTCHHCKFIYPDYLLVTCKFTSDKQAIPKMHIEASMDPNLIQVQSQGPHRNRTSQRFMTRKKNCLTSYAKIHDEYICGRKYCKSCIKDHYSHDSIKENGFCPFCEGSCCCTRCLRNQKIAKFKQMYSSLGGDLAILHAQSQIEKLQAKNQQQIPRGRGRPKKIKFSVVPTSKNHLHNISDAPKSLLSKKIKKIRSGLTEVHPVIVQSDSSDTTMNKRKRGRPPKSNPKLIANRIKTPETSNKLKKFFLHRAISN